MKKIIVETINVEYLDLMEDQLNNLMAKYPNYDIVTVFPPFVQATYYNIRIILQLRQE